MTWIILEKAERPKKWLFWLKKSKFFIKTKLTVSKSCLLGVLCFMIFCILMGVLIQITKYLSIWVFKLPFLGVLTSHFISHILIPILKHELMLDNFLITSSVMTPFHNANDKKDNICFRFLVSCNFFWYFRMFQSLNKILTNNFYWNIRLIIIL